MADSTIPGLVAVTIPAGTDLLGVRQSGDTRDKKLTVTQLLSLSAVPDPLLLNAGSVADPTYSFSGDPDTGVFNTSADVLGLVAGGVEGLRLAELNSGVIQVPNASVAVTAFAGGGQGSAVQLDESYSVIGTVATAGDSVKLPPVFAINSTMYIKNDGANAADVFPASGDDLGAGVDTAVSLLPGKSLSFIATTADSIWTQLLVDTTTVLSGGLLSAEYRFSTTLTEADPGPGNFRYNSATPASVTAIFIDDFTNNGIDISNLLGLITTGDRLYFQTGNDSAEFIVFNVTAPITDNTGWFTIAGTVEASGDLHSNNANCILALQIGGATTGGDVTKVGTPVDNQVGVWTGDGTLEGTTGLTYDGSDLDITGNITLTGTVDGIDIATDVAANTAKVTNATHTGQVTGAVALVLDITAITAQPAAGALIGADTFIVNDGGTLSEITATQMATFFSGGASFPEFQFSPLILENPNNADWTVNALAPAVADSNNNGLTVRAFDDTAEEGVGFQFEVPAGATNIVFSFRSRAETTPGGAVTVGLDIYNRGIPDNAAVQAWSSATQLTDLNFTTNEFFQEDSQTVTLATLGITAGELTQFELTRVAPTGGSDLTGDWILANLKVSFT